MLSYRHAFHAGNYADVLKHLVLTRTLSYMAQKSAPICYIDTHAGAGGYSLLCSEAKKTDEFSRYNVYKSSFGIITNLSFSAEES